jgi:hypothetical protein
MNRKTLTLAIAATLMLPITTSADVKLSGTIQGEAGGAVLGQVNGEEKDALTLSTDSLGALVNSGPNHIKLDVDEKLGGGLTAYARYRVPFNTSTNDGLGRGQEAWLGLKMPMSEMSSLWLKFGKIEGVYKVSKGLLDPFAGTAIQQRGTAGGMSGSQRPNMTLKGGDVAALLPKDATAIEYQQWANKKTYQLKYKVPRKGTDGKPLKDEKGNILYDSQALANEFTFETGGFESTKHYGLSHGGEIDNLLEVGIKAGDLSLTVQGVFDETDAVKKSSGLVEVKYSMADRFTVFAAASSDELFDQDMGKNGMLNWKVGAQFKAAGLVLGLQYEDAEMGAFDPNSSGGKYILGSVDYKLNNVLVGGWVSQYTSDINDSQKWVIGGESIGEDAINWAVGIKYLFSARTLVYLGYLQTDSDNDYRDQQIYGGGLRHSF